MKTGLQVERSGRRGLADFVTVFFVVALRVAANSGVSKIIDRFLKCAEVFFKVLDVYGDP